MLSVNVLKLAILTSSICVSIIYQFMNVHHNIKLIKFIISDDGSNYSAESDEIYK